jgi:CBS domain containing-hemolysin-like protein
VALILLILLILSSFFSATETALISLGKLKTKEIIEEKRFYILQNWLDNPAEWISGILVGNNIVNILFSVLFTYWALRSSLFSGLARGWAEILILIVVALLILFFGEIIPKTFAHTFPERIALLTYRLFFFILRLLSPLVKFFVMVAGIFMGKKLSLKATKVTRQELEGLMVQGREEGVIERKAEEMIKKVLNFDQISVRNVMTGRANIDWVDINQPDEKFIDLVVETGRSRVPVYSGNVDNIVGMVYARDLLSAWQLKSQFEIRDVLRPAYYVPPGKKCNELFQEFREKRIHAALIEEKGKIVGLVTMEDLLEEILGEIVDEFDLIRA